MAARRRHSFAPREEAIQAAVIEHWLAFGLPYTLVAAVPNKRAFGQSGLTPGLFDLIVITPTLGDKTGWLELKRDDGELSPAQRQFKLLLARRGVPHAVTYGRDQPIDVLKVWGAVRQ